MGEIPEGRTGDIPGSFRRHPRLWNMGHEYTLPLLLLVLAALSSCANENLVEVRAATPVQTGTFQAPYDALATCAKERIETDVWPFGPPTVHWKREKGLPLIRVYATYSRSTLFDVTFQRAPPGHTAVEYRRGLQGPDIQKQIWGIIVSCARQGFAPVN